MRRALGVVLRPLAVALPPANQATYRQTATADTQAILRKRPVVLVVGLVTLVASVVSIFTTTKTPVLVKALLAALGAGVGAFLVLVPLMLLATLATAPHRQRTEARATRAASVAITDRYRDRLELFSVLQPLAASSSRHYLEGPGGLRN